MKTKFKHILLTFLLGFLSTHAQNLQAFIVQLHPEGLSRSSFISRVHWHLSLLEKSVSNEEDLSSRFMYSYSSAIEGFAAQLSPSEVEMLKKLQEVLAVRSDRRLEIHATYSNKFLGLSPTSEGGAWMKQLLVFLIPEFGLKARALMIGEWIPIPRKWKGICLEGQGYSTSNCNKKIIGAQYFSKGHRVASFISSPYALVEYVSARDSHDHETHTASTAGGAPVPLADVLGNGAGGSRNGPGAHIGVDVFSLSLGGFPVPLYEDTIAIGSFRAKQHGISVICAAGNNGLIQNSVVNEAPWITTVGASTLDRRFPAVVDWATGNSYLVNPCTLGLDLQVQK